MTIAFIDHVYHKRTGSSGFFLKLLREIGHVTEFYDTSGNGTSEWLSTFRPADYDCVVVWQAAEILLNLPHHPNLIFVPMFDHLAPKGKVSWHPRFAQAKVICFCQELYRQVSSKTPRAILHRYFPNPAEFPEVAHDGTLRGLFWRRVDAIQSGTIARLCGSTVFDQMTLHDAPDPGFSGEAIEASRIPARAATVTTWFSDQEGFLKNMAKANVFFAPRLREGIGLTTLEAMAMGLCVVAPDSATHNEYISHNRTGLLYDPRSPKPLRFDEADSLGRAARNFIAEGFAHWNPLRDELASFVMDSVGRRCSA